MLLRRFCCMLVLLTALVACKKKPVKVESPIKPDAVIPAPPVLEGFPLVSRLPHEMEACFASSHGREHLAAMLATNAWQRWTSAKELPLPPLEEVCMAAGPGFGEALRSLRPLARAWSIMQAREWMGRFIVGSTPPANDLAAMDELVLALERFEMPLLLAGLKGPQAHDWLKQIAEPVFSAPWFVDAPASMITTTHGEQIALNEIETSKVLTPAMRKTWLAAFAAAHPGLDAVMREKVAHALDVIAGKTLVIAVGKGKDSTWIGVAGSKEQFRLADSPEDSMAAVAELQFVSRHQNQPLIGLALCRGVVLDALHEEPLLVPVLRGMLSGWETVPVASVFAPALASALPEAKHDDSSPRRDAAAVAWWDEGLHVEARGGLSREQIEALGKPTRFAPIIEGDKVLLAQAGVSQGGDASWETAAGWIGMLHAGALVFADSGLAGPKGNLLWAKFLHDAVPASREIWDSGRGLIQKGLDEDGAFVLDAGGVMPALPGLPKGGEQVALPRLCWTGGIQNRAMISTSWSGIESGLTHLLATLPGNPPPQLPAAGLWREDSLVSHFYELPFGSEDLMLAATLDDKTLFFGSSRIQQRSLERMLSDEKAAAGAFFRFDVSRLHSWLTSFAEVRAKNGGAEALSRFLHHIEPLGDLRLHSKAKGGVMEHSLRWQMQDVAAP